MHFVRAIALGLISTALATPLTTRDAAPVLSAIANVRASLLGIDGVIDDLVDPSDVARTVADLNTRSTALVATLKAGTAKVSAAAPLSVSEGAAVTTAAVKLGNFMKHIIGDFVEKRDMFTEAGQTKLVLADLNAQRTAAQGFFSAVSAKLPASLTASIATIGGVVTAIDSSIAAFASASSTTR